jgi:hypothetical protein
MKLWQVQVIISLFVQGDGMEIKIGQRLCTKCNEIREVSLFSKWSRRCILCKRHESKIYQRNLSKDEKNVYMRKWYKTENGIKARKKSYKNLLNKGYYENGNGKYNNLKQSALKRGYEFNLTENELKKFLIETPEVCFYCGIPIEEYLKLRADILKESKSKLYKTMLYRARGTVLSIDRIDNEKGYSLDNIVKCCWICNSIKGVFLNVEEMKVIGKSVIQRLQKTYKGDL